tara:strand:- start:22560 stop:22850 length:291 start_codon:yes stop_codon:yes gene_type:complete
MPKPKTSPPPAPRPKTSKRTEVDPAKLKPDDAKKRCAAIYKCEKAVELKTAAHELAKGKAKISKAALVAAEDALRQEISEQRFGPGPLFPPEGAEE